MFQTATTDPAARAAFVAGFRALAEFLDAHPGLPVPRYSLSDGLTVYADGSDADKRAEVDRVALILGAASAGRRYYQAARQFRGPVTYRIVAVPDADLASTGGGA